MSIFIIFLFLELNKLFNLNPQFVHISTFIIFINQSKPAGKVTLWNFLQDPVQSGHFFDVFEMVESVEL